MVFAKCVRNPLDACVIMFLSFSDDQ